MIAASALGLSAWAFWYFTLAADRAMDKSGVGNLARWDAFDYRATLALWLAVAVWSAMVVWAFWLRPAARGRLLFVCALAPVVSVLGFALVRV